MEEIKNIIIILSVIEIEMEEISEGIGSVLCLDLNFEQCHIIEAQRLLNCIY